MLYLLQMEILGNLTLNIDGPAGEVKENHWDVFTIWGTTDVSELA